MPKDLESDENLGLEPPMGSKSISNHGGHSRSIKEEKLQEIVVKLLIAGVLIY